MDGKSQLYSLTIKEYQEYLNVKLQLCLKKNFRLWLNLGGSPFIHHTKLESFLVHLFYLENLTFKSLNIKDDSTIGKLQSSTEFSNNS